jgi:hypothetical protein
VGQLAHSTSARPTPEEALRDPRNAIVQVDGYLPPGVRKGRSSTSRFPRSPTTTRAASRRATSFRPELRILGANPLDPGGSVNVFARAEGPIFVNPAYALKTESDIEKRSWRAAQPAHGADHERRALRWKTARSAAAAPAVDAHEPLLSSSASIQRFQEIRPDVIAAAQDEGIVHPLRPAGPQRRLGAFRRAGELHLPEQLPGVRRREGAAARG